MKRWLRNLEIFLFHDKEQFPDLTNPAHFLQQLRDWWGVFLKSSQIENSSKSCRKDHFKTIDGIASFTAFTSNRIFCRPQIHRCVNGHHALLFYYNLSILFLKKIPSPLDMINFRNYSILFRNSMLDNLDVRSQDIPQKIRAFFLCQRLHKKIKKHQRKKKKLFIYLSLPWLIWLLMTTLLR